MLLHYDEFPSPVGRILFASDGQSICMLDFAGCEDRMTRLLRKRYPVCEFRKNSDPQNLKNTLRDYFDGDIQALESIPARTDGTPFQEIVWKALREIPPGKTWSYGQLAQHIGRPQASRAVGRANGTNPVAIIVPCHRVIGASADLTGYGGGLDRKEWLLKHEGAFPPARSEAPTLF